MRRLLLPLVLILAGLTPAWAFDTPEALLKALYSPYAKGDQFDWSKWDDAQFRSTELNALFAKDLKEANGDEAGSTSIPTSTGRTTCSVTSRSARRRSPATRRASR